MNTTRVITSDAYLDSFAKSVKEVSYNVDLLIHNNAVFINSKDRIFHLDSLSETLQCLDYKEALTKVIVDILTKQSITTFRLSPFFSDFSAEISFPDAPPAYPFFEVGHGKSDIIFKALCTPLERLSGAHDVGGTKTTPPGKAKSTPPKKGVLNRPLFSENMLKRAQYGVRFTLR